MSEINYSKKQINPLIEKYQINPETNKTFQSIITMFADQPNYHVWAIKCVFDNVISLTTLQHIKAFADENQTLISKLSKQNLVAYKTKADFEMLNKEISGAIALSIIKKGINQFNTNQREMLNKFVFPNGDVTPLFAATDSNFKKHIEFFKKLNSMSAPKRHNLIVTASAINSSTTQLISHINTAFNASYIWDKEDLLGFVKTNEKCKDVKVIYDKDSIVILEIPNFGASEALCGGGRTAWCLTRESSYFNQYAGKAENRQYFYFDFSKKENHELAHVGFTVNNKGGYCYAHSTNNNSMIGNGIRVGGQNINIQTLLKMANVNNNLFIHLNGIKGFAWNLEGLINIINANSNDVAMCLEKDGRVVVRLLTQQAFNTLCSNTLISSNELRFDNKTGIVYVLFDTNVDSNAEGCMVTVQCAKDKYGTMSVSHIWDAYKGKVEESYLNKIGLPLSSFMAKEKIAPSILLHKLIDEGKEDEAVKLIESGDKDLDINYEFNQNTPIFSAINNNLAKVFGALIAHPSFNAAQYNAYGEPMLQSLIYSDRYQPSEGYKNMIRTIITTKGYNLNAQNINLDTALSVAVERTETDWITDILVANPNVDINTVNDTNRTTFENALGSNNRHAVEALGHRPDLVIREETAFIGDKSSIKNWRELIKPIPFEEGTTANAEISKISASEYAKLFQACFAK